jgi:hypothetical protein
MVELDLFNYMIIFLGGIASFFGIIIAEQNYKVETKLVLQNGIVFLIAFIIIPFFILQEIYNYLAPLSLEITLILNLLTLILLIKSYEKTIIINTILLFVISLIILPYYSISQFPINSINTISIYSIFPILLWLLNLSIIAILFGKGVCKYNLRKCIIKTKVTEYTEQIIRIEEDYIILSNGKRINKNEILEFYPTGEPLFNTIFELRDEIKFILITLIFLFLGYIIYNFNLWIYIIIILFLGTIGYLKIKNKLIKTTNHLKILFTEEFTIISIGIVTYLLGVFEYFLVVSLLTIIGYIFLKK